MNVPFIRKTLLAATFIWELHNCERGAGLHPAIATTSTILAAVMAITLLAMITSRRTSNGRHFGLIERGFYLTMTAWLATVAVLTVLPG